MIAIAGWRTWLQGKNRLALKLWFAQMLLNFSWSPAGFRFHSLALGQVIILGMLASTVAFIIIQAQQNRTGAILFIPYAAWVTFAATLNYSFLLLNP